MRDRNELHSFYIQHLTEQLLPFWKQAVDNRHGGVFTGFNAEGNELVHRDKYTWSQGRFLWIWSRIVLLCREGILSESADLFKQQAEEAYQFLVNHAFMENGNCRFLLTEDGLPKEMIAGEGHDISFYADCFVIMGFAEYAVMMGSEEAFDKARELYQNVERRLMDGTARSEPYQVPCGMRVHGAAMIMLNTAQALARAAAVLGEQDEAAQYRNHALFRCRQILYVFRDAADRIHEVLRSGEPEEENDVSADKLLLRHLNPGHSAESLWFVMQEGQEQGDATIVIDAARTLKAVLEAGWDDEFGGLLRYIDLDGGQPKGEPLSGGEKFEALIRETWDMKLWWPHSEGLYACRLAYELTKDEAFLNWYDRLHAYSFKVFPAGPGREWIQIRGRDGAPVERVVALPVKDPYHIIRNILLMIELTVPKHVT